MNPAELLEEYGPDELLEVADAELCRRSFTHFVKVAWDRIDPTPLVWGWYLEAMCEHLQAVAEGRITHLLINIPPGHAKSMIVSVLWPVWRWIREPWWRVMVASYEIGLVNRDAVKARELIETQWFKKHFRRDPKTGKEWALQDDQNNKSFYQNTSLGFRIALSVGGKGTGYRGDCLVIDDPLNMNDAGSKTIRDECIRWKTETMASRFNDLVNKQEVLVMQRLHEDDLSGYLLKAGGWQHLCLPSEFEEARRCRTYAAPPGKKITNRKVKPVLFFTDPRTTEGELLFPERFPQEALEEAKSPRGMGPIAYAGQHQQRPMPAGGGVMKASYFARRWHFPKTEAPVLDSTLNNPQIGLTRREYDPREHNIKCARMIVSDCSFKKTEDNDLVAVGVFDVIYPDIILVDWLWARMGFVETVNAIKQLRNKWSAPGMPFVRKIGIEDRANGPAVIEVLKREVPGIYPIEPLGSKEARIEAAASFMASGNVWFPEHHSQLTDGIHQALTFPKGSHDDWIDMVAYGVLLGLAGNKIGYLERLCRW